jgi:hypothetical protein
MADTAAHLVDRVFPEVPVRQVVLLLPFALRYRLVFDQELCSEVLRIFVQSVFTSLRRRASIGVWCRARLCIVGTETKSGNGEPRRDGSLSVHGSRSERGTRVAALFYSLIESAKLAGVEPRAYLGEAARQAIRSPGAVTLARDLK